VANRNEMRVPGSRTATNVVVVLVIELAAGCDVYRAPV